MEHKDSLSKKPLWAYTTDITPEQTEEETIAQ